MLGGGSSSLEWRVKIYAKSEMRAGTIHSFMDERNDPLEMVAYCGLYCGECFGHQGRIADLARDLRKELRMTRFDLTAETLAKTDHFDGFSKYEDCYQVLGAMVKIRFKSGCRSNRGSPYCGIRECSKSKGMDGCWECDAFEECEKLEFLEGNHGIAHIRNLRRISQKGIEGFLDGKKEWYVRKK
jgi:hypothetical protein